MTIASNARMFVLEDRLAVDLDGWGILEGPLGGLKNRFTVSASGSWDKQQSILSFQETWTIDNGIVETIVWTIRKLGDGRYSGDEQYVEGSATGEQAGRDFHWTYTRATPQPGGDRVTLNFDDWFYAIDDDVFMVRGSAGRLGLPFLVAHVTYRRRNRAAATQSSFGQEPLLKRGAA